MFRNLRNFSLPTEICVKLLVYYVLSVKLFLILLREHEDFIDLSFSTISSSGPHGAIIHYSPTPETDRPITTEELYLCDSGAQFR